MMMTGTANMRERLEIGGFSFENTRRNQVIAQRGSVVPRAKKTGTTIVGVIYDGGVVLGAVAPSTNSARPFVQKPLTQPATMPYAKNADGKWVSGAGSPVIPAYTSTGGTEEDKSAIEEIILNLANFTNVEEWAAFCATQPADAAFIRPSGNPISMKGLADMMTTNGDITDIDGKLVAINKLDISGDMAYSACTQEASFKYQGKANDDLYVNTYVFKKIDGTWKNVWGQRSTGRPPAEGPITGW